MAVRAYVWETVLAGIWRDIGDSTTQDGLDSSFVAGSDGYRFRARGYDYEIDFGRMVQINLSTKRERELRRVARAAVPTSAAVSFVLPKPMAPAPLAPVAPGPVPASIPAPPAPVGSTRAKPAAAPTRGKPGRVTKFFKDKGFGFIALDDSTEVFFHVSSLNCVSLAVNDKVDCQATKDGSGRLRASYVQVTAKAPIMRVLCTNPMCKGKKDSHFEDRCTHGAAARAGGC